MLKFNNQNDKTKWKTCLKLAIKAPEQGQWSCSVVFLLVWTYFILCSGTAIFHFEHVMPEGII